MLYNNIYYPPYQPSPEYYMPQENETTRNEIIEFPKTKEKKNSTIFDRILNKTNIEFDDLIILGILFFLYTEKCNDLYLYIALILLFLDIDFESIISQLPL